jgi:hypothetical protein
MKNVDLVAAYDALIEKAVKILRGSPFHKYIYNQDFARLEIDGDTAILRHCHDGMEYGDPVLDKESESFPAEMLQWEDADIAEFQKREAAKEEARRQEASKRAAQAQERKERALLDALRAKYER